MQERGFALGPIFVELGLGGLEIAFEGLDLGYVLFLGGLTVIQRLVQHLLSSKGLSVSGIQLTVEILKYLLALAYGLFL